MGLDMHLIGELWFNERDQQQKFPKQSESYELGYWRKHPNLHGFIVDEFADGIDNCNEIWLSKERLEIIINAIEQDLLPETTGCFFGISDGSEKESDLTIFRDALAWLKAEDVRGWRSIHYQASW